MTPQLTLPGYDDAVDEQRTLATADDVLAAAAGEDPDYVVALVSGGHDSLTAFHVAHESPHVDVDAVAHINTGIGVPETREFVQRRCADLDVPFIELKNGTWGERYVDMVLKYGFPGPTIHKIMYRNLKERCLNGLCRSFPGTLALVSGVRRHESRNRMENVPIDGLSEDSRALWLSPLTDWTTNDIRRYRDRHDLPANPVVETLGMSGECLCGAYADRIEYRLLREEYPAVGRLLLCIESQVTASAFVNDIPEEYTYWGHGNRRPVADIAMGDSDQMLLCTDCAAGTWGGGA